ncbi:MAG: metal-dependent hydrolase [Polyangiales bacterium]|nr:metal-dependent hydrolase [Myxococcales bacterium]
MTQPHASHDRIHAGLKPRAKRSTPPIEPRRMSFDFESERRRFWYADNAVLTVFMSALSSTFPPGEREFVRSVLHYREQLDGELLEQVRAFAAQEGHHARQHTLANQWIDSLGFDAKGCAEHLEAEIEAFRKETPDDVLLAATVCAEHLTAIMAHYLLTHDEIVAGLPEAVRELILWHAVEEIEHKAVAMDVYDRVSGDRDKLRKVFVVQTLMFATTVGRYMGHMLRAADYKPTPREWLGGTRFLLGPNGLIPGIAKAYVSFFRKDFHPWDHDDRHLIDAWKANQAARHALAKSA